MRILAISNVFPPGFIGGYELGALEVVQGLKAAGHDLLVLTSDYFTDDDRLLNDLPVNRVLECPSLRHSAHLSPSDADKANLINTNNIRKLTSAIVSFSPDIVLSFNLSGLGAPGIVHFLNATRMPACYFLMDNMFREGNELEGEGTCFENVFGRLEFGPRSAALMMSRNLANEVARFVDTTKAHTVFIPGWVRFPSVAARFRKTDGTVNFVFSSRIASHKNYQMVLDAAQMLSRKTRPFKVDFYGSGEVGLLHHQIQSMGLGEVVRYRGSLSKSDMTARFADYDVLLFPTHPREAFGFVVSEAAAAACLPVMTAGIGASEWFVDSVDCFKIRASSHDLATAMEHILDQPRESLDALRMAAVKAARLLDEKFWFQKIDEVLRRLRSESSSIDNVEMRRVESAFQVLSDLWMDVVASDPTRTR